MRGALRCAAVCAAALMPAGVASAQVSEGGVTSPNVQWLGHIAQSAGTAEGGRLVGKTFFLTNNQQGLLAYDVSQPESPKEVGRFVAPHAAENEDVATNGRILLLSQLGDVYHLSDGATGAGSVLLILDVRDPSNIRELARVEGAGDHTWDCLYDCTWAYSASGQILDLRDPARPRKLRKRWREAISTDLSPGLAHDVTEVAPGYVMVATTPMVLLDVRDPANPEAIATAPEDSANSQHNVVWPRLMEDRFIVTASEGANVGRCEAYGGARLQIWDAAGWERARTWEMRGSYRPPNGTQVDGNPPVSATWYGCSAHWAETHPNWHDGGLIAGAFYSHGARLLQVGADGEPREIGWFLAHGAGASAVYWITDRVLYVADDTRGLDVLRYTGPVPEKPRAPAPQAVAPPASPGAPLVDRRAPRVRVTVRRLRDRRVLVAVRCSEDCFGRVNGRRLALRRGATKRFRLGRVRRVKITVSDRAGNRRVVRRKVR